MRELGEFLGWMIVISYIVTALNFIAKWINKKFAKQISKSPAFKKYYMKMMKLIVKNHKLFGFFTILFIISHFIVQFTNWGINLAGVFAGSILIVQVSLGVYGGLIKKKREGLWFDAHRIIAVVLAIAIVYHIL